jgi:molecular chaperone IbpA
MKGAAFENGPLLIDLVREIPEAVKPRQIEINASNVSRLEQRKAA